MFQRKNPTLNVSKDTARAVKALSHSHALRRITSNNLQVGTVIDVGAAKGDWSALAHAFWPDAAFHLLEAKEYWRKDLIRFCARSPKFSFSIAGVSETPGVAHFEDGADAFGGAAYGASEAGRETYEIAATSIDNEVSRLGLEGPFAIKLDTHGTEADILKGAGQTLKNASLVCIETYNLIGQLHFSELIGEMRTLGFGCVDLAEPLFRPRDGALWQLDFFFLPLDHAVFQDASYS